MSHTPEKVAISNSDLLLYVSVLLYVRLSNTNAINQSLYPSLEPSAPSFGSSSVPAYHPPPYQEYDGQMNPNHHAHSSSSSSSYGAIYPPVPPSHHEVPIASSNSSFKQQNYNSRTPIVHTVERRTIHEQNSGCSDLGNILWFFFGGGFIFFLIYGLIGCVLCISVVFLPFGLQLFKLAKLSAFAFGKVINRPDLKRDYCRCCANLLWLPIGFIIGLLHMSFAVSLFMTIIGIPFAIQHIKLVALALWPFGADVGYHHYHTLSTETRVDFV
eukprot:CFRG1171T1